MNKINQNIIVTAYYIIENKRPSSDFNEWIKNFMYLNTLKVIFTNKNTFDTIFSLLYKDIIYEDLNIYKDHVNNSIFINQEL